MFLLCPLKSFKYPFMYQYTTACDPFLFFVNRLNPVSFNFGGKDYQMSITLMICGFFYLTSSLHRLLLFTNQLFFPHLGTPIGTHHSHLTHTIGQFTHTGEGCGRSCNIRLSKSGQFNIWNPFNWFKDTTFWTNRTLTSYLQALIILSWNQRWHLSKIDKNPSSWQPFCPSLCLLSLKSCLSLSKWSSSPLC